tara:strand:+ start:587 stop:769 length:183 start_codon:yes stop_codon:yes gene_type:complete
MYTTVKDLSARWQVSKNTVLRLLKNKALPSIKLGSLTRIPESAVYRFERNGGISKIDQQS